MSAHEPQSLREPRVSSHFPLPLPSPRPQWELISGEPAAAPSRQLLPTGSWARAASLPPALPAAFCLLQRTGTRSLCSASFLASCLNRSTITTHHHAYPAAPTPLSSRVPRHQAPTCWTFSMSTTARSQSPWPRSSSASSCRRCVRAQGGAGGWWGWGWGW